MTAQFLLDTCETTNCDAIAAIRLWTRGRLGWEFQPRGIFCHPCANAHVDVCDNMAELASVNDSIYTPRFACSYEWLPAAELDGDLAGMLGVWQKMETLSNVDAASTCRSIGKFVDQVLEGARSIPDLHGEPVNWESLGCDDVSIGCNGEGQRVLSVRISEAGQNATKLANHVYRAINERLEGYAVAINVDMEW